MTLVRYTIFMLIIAVLCWAAWIVVLMNIDPLGAGILGFIVFYVTMFFAMTTTFSVFGMLLRRWFVNHQAPAKQVATALRQGVWFSLLIIGTLILISQDLLTWWNILLFIAVLATVEFFFLSFSNNSSE